MEKRRLLIWQTAGASFLLGFRAIRTFPVASLFVVAALLAIRNYHFPDSLRDLAGFGAWTSVFRMSARTAVLAPLAVLVHRSIVLGDHAETYWSMWTHKRTVRFLGALLLLSLVDVMPDMLPSLGRPASEWAWYLCFFWAASAVLWTRLCLAFPIIATDAAESPFRESFRHTSGSSWMIFFVFLVIGAAHLAFDIVAYYRVKELPILATAGLSLAFDAAWVAVNTFFFIVYVATASHLWRTRATWSGRGDAIPAGATTSATP